jgi:hypothetical protein
MTLPLARECGTLQVIMIISICGLHEHTEHWMRMATADGPIVVKDKVNRWLRL